MPRMISSRQSDETLHFNQNLFPQDPNGEHESHSIERHRLKLLYEIPHNVAQSLGDKATFHLSGEHLKAALGGDFGLQRVLVGPVDSKMGTVGLTLHYDQEGNKPIEIDRRMCLSPISTDRLNVFDDRVRSIHEDTPFVITATGTRLGSTEVELHPGDHDTMDAFEQGLGITLHKLDNSSTRGTVSFVQLLLMRDPLIDPFSSRCWGQRCESAIVNFQIRHSREYSIESDESSVFIGAERLAEDYNLPKSRLQQVTRLTVLEVKSQGAVGPVGVTLHHDKYRSRSIKSPTRTVFVSGVNGCAMAYHHVITPMNAFDRHVIELNKPCDFSSGFCFTLHRLTQAAHDVPSAEPLFSCIRLELHCVVSDAPNR